MKALFGDEKEILKKIVREVMQEILEQEMADSPGAAKGERLLNRLGYRSGYYERSLITLVGKLELRVPQDGQGQFPTRLFECDQRSERRIWAPPWLK